MVVALEEKGGKNLKEDFWTGEGRGDW